MIGASGETNMNRSAEIRSKQRVNGPSHRAGEETAGGTYRRPPLSASDDGQRSVNPCNMDLHEMDPHEIAVMAYLRWESGGCEFNTAEEDWLWAERELLKLRKAAARSENRNSNGNRR